MTDGAETPSPKQIEQILGGSAVIQQTVVLCRAEDDAAEAYALTQSCEVVGSEISIGDWSVILLSLDSPIGRALRGCQPGDSLSVKTPNGALQAEVIACNGSPILSSEERLQLRARQVEESRQRAEQEQTERAERLRRLAEEETVRLLRERRKEQEAHQRANESLRRTAWEARQSDVAK